MACDIMSTFTLASALTGETVEAAFHMLLERIMLTYGGVLPQASPGPGQAGAAQPQVLLGGQLGGSCGSC